MLSMAVKHRVLYETSEDICAARVIFSPPNATFENLLRKWRRYTLEGLIAVC